MEYKSPFLRSGALFSAGIIVGVAIGIAVASSRHSFSSADATRETTGADFVRTGTRTLKSENEDTHVLLGNITTVPFQELYGVLATLSVEKLDSLARQLDNLPAGPGTNAKVTAFFKAWAHLDPGSALAAASSFKKGAAKVAAVQAIIEGADNAAASTLAKSINQWPSAALNREERNRFLAATMTKWAEVDASSAAKFLDSLSDVSTVLAGACRAIAQNWAAVDPAAALQWARARDERGNVKLAVDGAVTGWWQKEPAAAEEYVASRSNTAEGRQLVGALAHFMCSSDPERAKEWASQLPDADARRQADAIIGMRLSWNDPKSATEWAATLPDDVRGGALSSAVHNWTSTDATAAGAWINSLSGTPRDEAIGAYTSGLLTKDPATAAAWALSITDPKTRDSSLQRVAGTWLAKNSPEATAWIQNSALPADQKQQLLALAPKR